jgi:hypothetical protein
MSLNFCDLLVLGSDLSGIMTATLLAKRGMNVLILDDEEEEEPFPNLVTGLGSRSFRSLLGKLMIPDAKLQIFHENRVSCQVVFPKNRLDLHTSRPLFFKEIDREFPQEKPVLEELLGEIDRLRENYLDEILSFFPIIGSREKKRFIKWYQGFPDEKVKTLWSRLSPTLQSFLKVRLKFLSRSPLSEPLTLQLLLFLPPETGMTYSIRGGVRELKRLFFDKLDYFGGMIHPLSNDSFQVVTKGREVRAIQLGRYNFPTRCRYLLGNTDVRELYQQLPSPFLSFLSGGIKKKVAGLKPQEIRPVVQYNVAREFLPEPMKENVVYVPDPAAPLEGTNYLEINLHPLPKGSANGSDTLMTVGFVLPAAVDPSAFRKLQDEIDSRLHRLIPFANSHMKRVFPAPPAEEEAELFPVENDFALVEKIVRKRVCYPPSLFFPSLPSHLKNLYVVGPNILDWLGMEGKMLAALRAVDLIWSQELNIKNP